MDMRRRLRVVGIFAAIGFVISWLLLLYCTVSRRLGGHPDTNLLLYLCPPSIAALGLDGASLLVGLLGWLFISLSNAVLYSIPGAIVSMFIPRPKKQ
jgi:hypothetical protein